MTFALCPGLEHQVEAERGELMARVHALKDETKLQEEQIKDLQLRFSEVSDEAARNKSAATQMK